MEENGKKTLNQVNSRRRGFLTKLLAGGAAAASIPLMTSVSLGQDDDDRRGKGKGGKGKGGQGKGGQGKGKGDFGGKGMMNPEQVAARMIEEHDKDGDGKLSKNELVAALKQMMSRRMSGKGKGGFGGKGKGGFGGKGKGDFGGKGKGGFGGKGKGKGGFDGGQ